MASEVSYNLLGTVYGFNGQWLMCDCDIHVSCCTGFAQSINQEVVKMLVTVSEGSTP